MAMACLRDFTFAPLLLRSVPLLRRRMALSTRLEAAFPYLRVPLRERARRVAGIWHSRKQVTQGTDRRMPQTIPPRRENCVGPWRYFTIPVRPTARCAISRDLPAQTAPVRAPCRYLTTREVGIGRAIDDGPEPVVP